MAVFQLSSFCSKIPEDLLQAVFERFEIYDANFKLLRTEKWEEQWKEITKGCEPETVARLLALLQQTNDFRGEKAQTALQDASQFFLSPSRFEQFREECLSLENVQSCLLKAWLKNDEIFERACSLYVIDSISRSGWRLRTGIGEHECNKSPEALLSLSQEIKTVLGKQMRARFCQSRYIGERGESLLFRSLISDYNETSEEWEKGEFKGRPRLPARSLVFEYNPKRGTLNVTTQGFGRVKYRLHEAFCQTILGLKELPSEKPIPIYRLQDLLKHVPEFSFYPQGAVKSCAIVGMNVRDCRHGKVVSIHLAASDDGKGSATKAIYEQLNELFGSALQNQVEVVSVVLKMKLKVKYGNETFKNICISEKGMQHFDLGQADFDIHSFLVRNCLEEKQKVNFSNDEGSRPTFK
ncbi:hypothetical protein [uncultured Sutterella sp.]|uniref:hypothetical protein n=1 Tax=uncultured Sutterella sp. TaxID=286133 RepID=UPI0025FF3E07|nr:hypothetical protein [uncultured Sutterella sp.]